MCQGQQTLPAKLKPIMSTMGDYANYQLHEGTLLACSSFHFPGSEGACQQLTFGVSPGAAGHDLESASPS